MSSKKRLLECLAEPLLFKPPAARAVVRGSPEHPDLQGEVLFYAIPEGTLVMADVTGLPSSHAHCGGGIFGLHIHQGGSCSNHISHEQDAFADVGGHYNPGGCPHPYHAGDLPPLFGDHGHACMAVVTARFTVNEVAGKTVVIHEKPDDFTSQPSGNSGEKLACGTIVRE